MDDSLHYLIMANQMLVQRGLLEGNRTYNWSAKGAGLFKGA